jgi:hypothetical protein
MASVTKTITETDGNLSVTTSLYFGSFEDFMEYERVVNEKGQQDNQTTLKELVVGKQYRVVKDISDHYQDIGDIVTVTEYDEEDYRLPYRVEDALGNGSWLKPEEVEEI